MNNKDINAALAALNESVFLLEEEYMENGGEVTESTEQQEQYIENSRLSLRMRALTPLADGSRARKDLIKTLKAERLCHKADQEDRGWH